MCCFSNEPARVSDTQIFARGRDGRQILVYSMRYAADGDLAMVLPIPTPPGAAEEAVRFISLERCPSFFKHLRDTFPARGRKFASDIRLGARPATLKVMDVGAYEASFVPSPADFGRLDPRFRLPVQIWLELPHYADWGFAVFKLKPSAEVSEAHPMAFDFPRRDRSRIFFPTLHLHGPALEDSAIFDHALYCQAEPALNWHLQEWEDAQDVAGAYIDCEEASRLLDLETICWRAQLEGRFENRDTWIGRGESLPAKEKLA
jgi:hypothetical protein